MKKVFLMGDSLVVDYGKERLPQCGWGQYFQDFVNDEYDVRNYGEGGWSTKTFLTTGRRLCPERPLWEEIYAELKAGDLVLMCLGINDVRLEYEMKTSEEEYRENLTYLTSQIREKGADIVFCTLAISGGKEDSEDGWDYKLPAPENKEPVMTERWRRRSKVLCDIADDLSVTVLPFGEKLKEIYENMYQEYMKNNPNASIADGRNYVRYYFHLYNKAINTPIEDGGLGFNMPDRKNDTVHLNPRGALVYAKTVAQLLSETKYSDVINKSVSLFS